MSAENTTGIDEECELLTAAVVGAGVRGRIYADWAREHPDRLRVVAVAEPDPRRRARIADEHSIAPELAVADWQELAARGHVADVALICTQDADHLEPSVALARLGHHLLLEKPMAPTLDECERLEREVTATGVRTAVCHVLRYTPYTAAVKRIVASGRLGDIVSIEHLEPVGYWHMAHSYVRGNWRRESESSFLLLTKSSHDLDWISYVMDRPCRSVSSFGSLTEFRRDRKPPEAGAALRCTDCAHEPSCAFSARKIYLGRLDAGDLGWPLDVVAESPERSSVESALAVGPYGRCVYECDNDVVDHQVVVMEFEGGATASFTLAGLSEAGHRRTRIFGTRGELRGDGERITVVDFLSDEETLLDVGSSDATLAGGHGGGDDGLLASFVEAVSGRDTHAILSDVSTSLTTHRLVFAAEQARRERRVVDL